MKAKSSEKETEKESRSVTKRAEPLAATSTAKKRAGTKTIDLPGPDAAKADPVTALGEGQPQPQGSPPKGARQSASKSPQVQAAADTKSGQTKTGQIKTSQTNGGPAKTGAVDGAQAASARTATTSAGTTGAAMKTVSRAAPDEHQIAHRAWEIWQKEGCPDGRHLDHWFQAQRELSGG